MNLNGKSITLEEAEEMDNFMEGKCINCGEMRDSCEPDAEKYDCESCGKNTVFGFHWFVMTGAIR